MKLNQLTLSIAVSGCLMSSCATFNPGKTAQEWDLCGIGTEKVSPSPITPYLGFEKNQIYGFTGCNRINGGIQISGDKFTAAHVSTTMKMCPDAKYEQAFLQALGKAKKIEEIEDGFNLNDEEGKTLMSFSPRRMNVEDLNGQWLLTEMNGKAVPSDNETPFIQFDIKAKRFSGFTGCNRLTQSLDLKELKTCKANFTQMGMTKKFCHNHETEADFVDVLNHAEVIRVLNGQLFIYSPEAGLSLTFTKE